MPTVLCYGDSNTYGTAPMKDLDDDRRFGRGGTGGGERWTDVMHAALGGGWRLVEEGLPGRTTVLDDPIEGIYKNGLTYLPPCLESHRPVDVITIALGTNDLKARFGMPASDIAAGAGLLIECATTTLSRFGQAAKILLIAPPPIIETGCLAEMFAGGAAKSRQFGRCYSAIAVRMGVGFFDAGTVIESSPVDGIHFELDAHRKLGAAIAAAIKAL
jgi:lysophospholipase L1-like esterase